VRQPRPIRRRLLATVSVAVLAVGAVGGAHALRGTPAAPAAVRAAAPTWADVAPVLGEKCVSCHTTGGIAPFSLTSARAAAAHAQTILLATQRGQMPPWPPGEDSPTYLGSSRRVLTPEEKDLIARWVRGGAKLGSGAARPATADSTAPGALVTLTPRRSYLPRATGGGMDDYHCFLLDPHLTQDAFVTSALVRPQQAGIVHHVILFDAEGQNAADARRLDAASGGRGWTCFGGPGLSETHPTVGSASSETLGAPPWISAWVPGHTTNDLPSGTGVLLHAGALVVMQVHYNLMHMPMPDRSRAVLRLLPAAGAGLTPLDTMLEPAPVELPCPGGATTGLCARSRALADVQRKYGASAGLIPLGLLYLCDKSSADYAQKAGDARDLSTSCERSIRRPLRIYGVAGHMHTRGFDIRIELNPGTPRAQTLLHIPHWSFHWQDSYYLAQPVDAGPGDTIRVSCRFDNSAAAQPVVHGRQLAPRYVVWGEGTTDEMCLGLLQVAARTP
jgi:mono/diheme cytochrome c family protein